MIQGLVSAGLRVVAPDLIGFGRSDKPASGRSGVGAEPGGWERLRQFDRPFLTVFADADPVTRGADALFQAQIPGAAGLPHVTVANTGHFIREDAGEELAEIVAGFVARTS